MDAESRLWACWLLDCRFRESIRKACISGPIEDEWVSVKVGPTCAPRAKRREFEMRLINGRALQYGVRSIIVRAGYIIATIRSSVSGIAFRLC